MKLQRRRRGLTLLTSVLVLLIAIAGAPGAAAQDQDKAEGPWYDVPALPPQKPWLQWVVGTVFGLACLAVALKNPHRTHLD